MKPKLLILIASALIVAFAGLQVAWAARVSEITRLDGRAPVVRVTPNSTWLAAWSEGRDGKYTLYVIDTIKGERRNVTEVDQAGGLCWLPGKNQLLYCRGIYNDKVNSYYVTYYLYDVTQDATRKLWDTTDMLQTFVFDPIPAEDGSRAVHLTIGARNNPNFNIYFEESGLMNPLLAANANIGSDYDMSADGTKVYWTLVDEEGNLSFAQYSLEYGVYTALHTYPASSYLADGGALIKVDEPNQRAATLAWSQNDPQLQMYIFNFSNPNDLQAFPVRLTADDEILFYDWKGRGDEVYAVVHNTSSNEYSIEEIDIVTGARNVLVRGPDTIEYVDYCYGRKAYYFSVVDERNPDRPETHYLRLELDR